MKNLLVALCLSVCVRTCPAQSVDAVLARMDQAAPSFHSMSADVQMLTFTALLSDKTIESGTLEMQRLKPDDVRAVLKFTGAQSSSPWLGFQGKTLRLYYPKLNTYQDIPVGKDSNVLNQYLLLGFGSSGKELAQSYTITFLGTEKVAGQDTSKLLLLPRDQAVKQRLKKVTMWIPNNGANPVQQQFEEPSGNYRLLTYTNITLNPKIKGTLELKLPSGTKKES
jgi:outer membrane lipoprotein-sorting protein